MGLESTQRAFFGAISAPLPEDRELLVNSIIDFRPSATAEQFAKTAESIIKPGKKLSAAERLAIYQKQYWYRLIDCIYDDFPGLRAFLGDKIFYDVNLSYLYSNPSESYTMRNLGRGFLEFVSTTDIIPKSRRLAAIDLTALEWASVIAFDEESRPKMDAAALQLSEVASMKISLQPYITLAALNYPCDEIICELKRKERDRGEAAAELLQVHERLKPMTMPKREKVFLVIHRFDNTVFYKRLSEGGFCLLKALEAGNPLAQAFETAAAHLSHEELDDPAGSIKRWFEEWSALGWLTAPTADTTTAPL